jgi:hypothetical protein
VELVGSYFERREAVGRILWSQTSVAPVLERSRLYPASGVINELKQLDSPAVDSEFRNQNRSKSSGSVNKPVFVVRLRVMRPTPTAKRRLLQILKWSRLTPSTAAGRQL